MSRVCRLGHLSSSADYCDECGIGLDEGEAPAPAQPWEALVWADRAYFESQPHPDLSFPEGVRPRRYRLELPEVLVGRRHRTSHGVEPHIDLSDPVEDAHVSHLHASFLRQPDGSIEVVDLGSRNGTRINDSHEPVLPNSPVLLADGDHVHVGSWTTITVRASLPRPRPEPHDGASGAARASSPRRAERDDAVHERVWLLCVEEPDGEGSATGADAHPALAAVVALSQGLRGIVAATDPGRVVAAFPDAGRLIAVLREMDEPMQHTKGRPAVRAGLRVGVDRERVVGPARGAIPATSTGVAAVCLAANPGQVLVSERAAAELRPLLSDGPALSDLGTHRLSDLEAPRRLFQLDLAGPPAELSSPASLETRPNNLPMQLTRFIGRRREISRLVELVGDNRVCTVTGPGGVGKTRLALQVAARLLNRHPDGVWVADLAAVDDPDQVAEAVVAALGISEAGSATVAAPEPTSSRPASERIADHLQDADALLVLNDCEQIIGPLGDLVATLLARCPLIRVLVTSREPMHLSGEALLKLGPLAVPGPWYDTAAARESESVRLFIDRALTVDPDLATDADSLQLIGLICERVDGIPLGIELAAAWAGALPLSQVATMLDDRLPSLAQSAESPQSGRQPTLRAVVEWSHQLLSDLERALFRRLAVFAGGFTVDATSEICSGGGVERFDVATLLAGLVDKSLVEVEVAEDGKRYRLLEMTRAFAREQLVAAGELTGCLRAHCRFYVGLAERAEAGLAGSEQTRWVQTLDAEYDNLRLALATGRDLRERDDLRIAAALSQYMLIRGLGSDGAALLDEAIDAAPLPEDSLRAKALCVRALLGCFSGELDAAERAAEVATRVAEAIDLPSWRAYGLTIAGLAKASRGRLAEAEDLHRAALASGVGESSVRSLALSNLGNVLAMRGAAAEAEHAYRESLALRERQGDRWGLAWTCYRLGVLACWCGDVPAAVELFDDGREHARAIGFRQGEVLTLLGSAEARLLVGDPAAAEPTLEAALRLARQIGDTAGACLAAAALAEVGIARGDLAGAALRLTEPEVAEADTSVAAAAATRRSRAELAAARGDLAGSADLHRDVLRLRRQLGDEHGMLEEVEEIAACMAEDGRLAAAATLLAAARARRSTTGFPVPVSRASRVDGLAAEVAASPEPEVQAAFGRGSTMSFPAAVRAALGERPDQDFAQGVPAEDVGSHGDAALRAAGQSWVEALGRRLAAQHGEALGASLLRRYGDAFPTSYWTTRTPERAAGDIARIEARGQRLSVSLRQVPDVEDLLELTLIDGSPIALADVLPALAHMGLRVLDEHPYELRPADADPVWSYVLTLTCQTGLWPDEDLALRLFETAFERVWRRDMEDDDVNRLVLAGGMSAADVTVLRAYGHYQRQMGNAFSLSHIERAVSSHVDVARGLVELFNARFAPDVSDAGAGAGAEAQGEIAGRVLAAIDQVARLDDDRILRTLLRLVEATVRTTAFTGRSTSSGVLGLKLAAADLVELPKPRPMFEVFVYAPWTEGVHLRAGQVARGGIRWSERDDYRTEIHGLMKAQSVKNAVIVPTGAKGGFVVREASGDPQELAEQVRRCYADFIHILLELTDNIVDGEVRHPRDVTRYDAEDTYLVVAADKGTATFSDQANAISAEYGFWLGDAFASGGRTGYDHKALAITARGTWESVRRHFWRLGIDPDREDITVVGIGDMSGDVFGNGLLRSSHMRLVAAFDHRHIFLDPDPDPETTFIERQRLFKLPRSSWADFDPTLISAGGGVFPRDAKSVPLSPQCRVRLGVAEEQLPPDELVRAILRAPVDLLWNGGVGTFVKAEAESDAEAGDRASDRIRVDASSLRCRVVAEGGNLGFTQRARVECALNEGLINTDAIDNSGGVDCSDHEVNIKILLDRVIAADLLSAGDRDALLEEMAGDVCAAVLRNNRFQADALARNLTTASLRSRFHLMLMQDLERLGHLDRAVERLPTDREFEARTSQDRGLTAPELAVLLATSKLALRAEILEDSLPDDAYLDAELVGYFPPALAGFAEQMASHPLRREIVASVVSNEVLNRQEISFVFRVGDRTGRLPRDVVRGYLVARDVLDMHETWRALDELGRDIAADIWVDVCRRWNDVIEWLTEAVLVRCPDDVDPAVLVARYREPVRALRDSLAVALAPSDREVFDAATNDFVRAGLPPQLAADTALTAFLAPALDLADLAAEFGLDVREVGRTSMAVADPTNLRWLRARIDGLPEISHWELMARRALQEDLVEIQRRMTAAVLREQALTGRTLAAWLEEHQGVLQRSRAMVEDLAKTGTDAANLGLALRALRAERLSTA